MSRASSTGSASRSASPTPSAINQYPPEQRGSKPFQKELTTISGTSSHPISPTATITPEGAVNIARIEENLRASGSSSLSLHLDPNITPEDFNRDKSIHDWKKKKKTGKEAEALVQRILAERRAARTSTHVDLDSESTDSSLGSAFYDREAKWKGKELAHIAENTDSDQEEAVSHWSYDTKKDEDVGDVTRVVDIYNYEYVLELSEGEEYVPPAQFELEGEVYLRGGSSQDEDSSSSARTGRPKILACRDLSTSLTAGSLSEAVE